jgi:DNA-binding Lrp family transcriptional regulator
VTAKKLGVSEGGVQLAIKKLVKEGIVSETTGKSVIEFIMLLE